MEAIIRVEEAVKEYGDQTVLDHVSVSFEKAKIHGLVGRNGSGKTVLLRAIMGLIFLTKGKVFVRGKEIGKDIDFPENVGMIIEHPGLLNNYNAFDNLKIIARVKNKITDAEIRQAIQNVGLDPRSKKYVGKYSVGMRQRLALAMATMENPDLLILDEPMSGLDKSGAAEMRTFFKELRSQGKTVLIATHSWSDVNELCDTIHEMDLGKIRPVERIERLN